MLTLKVITEETSKVISGLKKKHFAGAEEAVQKAIELDKKRRETQTKLDSILAESKKYASQIGLLMKQGKTDEANKAKAEVALLKDKANNLYLPENNFLQGKCSPFPTVEIYLYS